MEAQKCYYASFNIGAIEFWASEIYLDKNSVLLEIENSFLEIAESLSKFSVYYIFDEEIDYNSKLLTMYQRAVIDLKTYGVYEDRDDDLDFFIVEQPIWANYEQKIRF